MLHRIRASRSTTRIGWSWCKLLSSTAPPDDMDMFFTLEACVRPGAPDERVSLEIYCQLWPGVSNQSRIPREGAGYIVVRREP